MYIFDTRHLFSIRSRISELLHMVGRIFKYLRTISIHWIMRIPYRKEFIKSNYLWRNSVRNVPYILPCNR